MGTELNPVVLVAIVDGPHVDGGRPDWEQRLRHPSVVQPELQADEPLPAFGGASGWRSVRHKKAERICDGIEILDSSDVWHAEG